MEKIGYVKWAILMGITLLLSLVAANVIAQPGFVSIDCGAKTNHTDENNITWVSDANYIDAGNTTTDTGSTTSLSYLQRLRFFPNPVNKSCYELPVAPNVTYLVRLWFEIGNYTGFRGVYRSFRYTIETPGMLISTLVTGNNPDPTIYEGIFVSSGRVLYICLVRISAAYDPFINAIELRTLKDGMYSQAKPGTMLYLQSRINVGGSLQLRYPEDKFDRIWTTGITLSDPNSAFQVSLKEPISSCNTKNLPPPVVMQTAWVMNVSDFHLTLPTAAWAKSLLVLYFAEIERLNISEYRSFYVKRTGEDPSATITLVRNLSTLELTFISKETDKFTFDLVKAPNSTSLPIINAFEYYTIHPTDRATNSDDIEALDAIKSRYDIKDWISDPCYKIPWKGLTCVNDSLANKISEINLSGKNLTGSVAGEIGQLTALIHLSLDNNHLVGPLPNLSNLTMLKILHLQNNKLNGNVPVWLFKLKNLKELSLDNNHLIGPLPNFSSSTMLEVLHLQNNNLSGSLPDWLFKFKNLKELFIQNNNFSGVIPAQVNYSSLNVISYGNDHLCIMYKAGECIQEIQETRNNSKRRNNSKSVVLGTTISGCLIVALAFMVRIAAYWRKRLNKDSSMILSKLKKSRAFTGKEMIGQWGSGSVFFGKLREEKDIAVKVHSSVHQFRNEVDVLSRAQHKNLVSLVGYCSESKSLMLNYEHMSGRSLWDSLHGPSAGSTNLNWKTRLKIALDAAQGLEFLHVGCTPKIIHMDVKSANILLDSNMNAKLADFGISRITSDGEASPATMTMAKGTPGYMDPEYPRTRKVTEKSDVYSFGVVLFEIISGRGVTNANDEEEFNLVQWVRRQHVGLEEIDAEMIDKRLGGKYNMKSIVRVAKVAVRCVEDSSNWRPSISEVVGEMKEAIIEENETNAQFPASEETEENETNSQFPASEEIEENETNAQFPGKALSVRLWNRLKIWNGIMTASTSLQRKMISASSKITILESCVG